MAVDIGHDKDGNTTIRLDWPELGNRQVRISVMDRRTRQFLSTAGWSKTRKTLAETTAVEGKADLSVDRETASRINPASALVVEDVFLGFREEATWPAASPVTVSASEFPPAGIAVDPAPGEDAAPPSPQLKDARPPSPPRAIVHRRRWAIPAALAAGIVLAAATGLLMTAREASDSSSGTVGREQPGTEARVNPSPAAAPQPVLPDRTVELEANLAAREAEILKLTARLRSAEDDRVELSKQLDARNAELKAAAAPDEPPAIVTTLRSRISGLERQLEIAKLRLDAFTGERDQLRTAAADRDKLQERVSVLEEELRKAQEERDAAVAAAAAQATPEMAETGELLTMGPWGAAADKGRTIEVSYNGLSQEAAVGEAFRKCEAARSPGDCEIIAVYRNECFAVARPVDPEHKLMTYGIGKGPTIRSAAQNALQDCQRVFFGQCTVAMKVCSPETLAAN